jgi:hypothetical protein
LVGGLVVLLLPPLPEPLVEPLVEFLFFFSFLCFFPVVVLPEVFDWSLVPVLPCPAVEGELWGDVDEPCAEEPAWANVNGETATVKAKIRIILFIYDLRTGAICFPLPHDGLAGAISAIAYPGYFQIAP